MSRTFRLGVRGSTENAYHYKLIIGGTEYTEKEIASDLSVSVSANTNGFGAGMLPSSTISGTVKFISEPVRNSRIFLYANDTIIGNWFLSEMEITNDKIMSFSGKDIISFCDNDYGFVPEYDNKGNITNSTIGAHIDFIQKTIKAAAQLQNDITIPFFDAFMPVETSETQNIRSMLSKISASGGRNYRQSFNKEEPEIEFFIMGHGTIYISDSNRGEITRSAAGETITGITCYTADNPYTPTLNFGELPEDYGIYYYGDAAPPAGGHRVAWNLLEICSPFMKKDDENITHLLNRDFGTEFTCKNIKIDGVKLINVCDKIEFESESMTFYADSINYSFTSNGIFASVSGEGRELSDFEYIGTTALQIAQRPAFGYIYGDTQITQSDGLQFVHKENSLARAASGKTETYKFKTSSGGFTSYDGVQSSNKEVTNIDVDKNAGAVTVTYKDGHKYVYSAKITETANGYGITDETEEWT